MALGANHTTITTAAAFIPELWTLEVIEEANKRIVMQGLITDMSAEVANGGDTIHIPNVSNLTTNVKRAQTQVTIQTHTEATTDMEVKTHIEASFLVEDIAEVQSKQNLRAIYTKKAGAAIAEALDTSLHALYVDITQSVTETASHYNDLVDAMATLKTANVPPGEIFYVICPTLWAKCMKEDEFVNSDYRGSEIPPVNSGYLGKKLVGAWLYESTNIPQAASGSPPVSYYQNMLIERGAFEAAIQMGPRAQANNIPEYLGTLVTIDLIYGVKTLRADHAVKLQTA